VANPYRKPLLTSSRQGLAPCKMCRAFLGAITIATELPFSLNDAKHNLLNSILKYFPRCINASHSLEEAKFDLESELNYLRYLISQGLIFKKPLSIDDFSSLLPTAHTISFALKQLLPKTWTVGFLLDQYDFIDRCTRSILSSMLLRSNRRLFFSIIAARPFTLILKLPKGFVTPQNDFSLTLVEYLPEEHLKYKELLQKLTSKLFQIYNIKNIGSISSVLRTSPHLTLNDLESLRKLFNLPSRSRKLIQKYYGFENLAALSSASIRSFLNICKECVLVLPDHCQWTNGIYPEFQVRGLANASRYERDRVKYLPNYPNGEILKLIGKIKKKIDISKHIDQEMPKMVEKIRYSHESLFGIELTSNEGKILADAFSEGVFQFCKSRDVGFSIPEEWRVQALLCPILGFDHNGKGAIDLKKSDFSNFKPINKPLTHNSKDISHTNTKLSKVFLSTPFSLSEDRINLFRDIFHQKNIDIITGQVRGIGQLGKIFNKIKATDLTLVELSELRPNVMLEMGLSLSINHRIFPLMEVTGNTPKPDLAPYPFIDHQGKTFYSFERNDIRRARDEIMVQWEEPVEAFELLLKSMHGCRPLRTKNKPRLLYIYYPQHLEGRWRCYLPKIKNLVSKKGYSLTAPPNFSSQLLEVEKIVWSICKSSAIIVDTSSQNEPDLLGCFSLGFAYGLKKGISILRLENTKFAYSDQLSIWPSDPSYYKKWEKEEDILDIIRALLF
jgi:hypothetical protein